MSTGTLVETASKQQESEPSTHYFHAEAHALSGELKHPIKQMLPRHAEVVLKNSRRADHLTETVDATSLEGLVAFTAAHSRVSGVKVDKKDRWQTDHSGWITLSTSVVEGLNVFEVISADRIVSQVSTEHALVDGHVPRVTFLGTQFQNLAVSGFPVPVELDLRFCGKKPEGDRPYVMELPFLQKVRTQTAKVCRMLGVEGVEEDAAADQEMEAEIIAAQAIEDEGEIEIPKDLKDEYAKRLSEVDRLIDDCENGRDIEPPRKITCSLVKKIGKIPIPGVRSFGNVLVIPDFGWVALADVEVGIKPPEEIPYGEYGNGNGQNYVPKPSNYFELTMLDMNLGCVGGGSLKAGSTAANGNHQP